MVTLQLPQFRDLWIHIKLFKDISNAESIHSNITTLPFGVIDATTVLSQEQLMSAVYKALTEKTYNRMRTKNLNSEVLFSLSPTSNIGDALRKFGIKPGSKAAIVILVSDNERLDYENELSDIIQGTEIEFSDDNLQSLAHFKWIQDNYKLSDFRYTSVQELSTAVVHAIQMRGL